MWCILRTVGFLLPLVTLVGCQVFYNEQNDKAAQNASQAFGEAGLGKALQAERNLLIKNQADRRELVSRSQLALRDATIALVVDGSTTTNTWGVVRLMTDERMKKIAGKSDITVPASCSSAANGEIDSLSSFRDRTKAGSQLAIARINLDFETHNANQRLSQIAIAMAKREETPLFSCSKQPSAIPAHLQGDLNLEALVGTYDKLCDAVNTAAKCIADLSNGEDGLLAKNLNKLKEIAAAKAEVTADVSKLREGYLKELDEIDSARGTPGEAAEFAEKLGAALEELEKVKSKNAAIQSHPVLSRLNELGRLTALVEKKKVLDAYIEALSGKESHSATASRRRVLLVANLVNRTTSQPPPPTAGILMEAEFTRQQIAAAQEKIERASEAERILKNQTNHLLDELGFLLDTQTQLTESAPNCVKNPMYASLATGVRNPCSMHASKALLSFTAAWTVGRIPAEQSDYLLIDQAELGALDKSEAALVQTEGVAKAAIAQIVALHASGIKPEHLAALSQALSLPVIALRVK